MPHTRFPKNTPKEILATATHDPEWASMLESEPIPTGSDWGDASVIKELSEGMYPHLRKGLDASRPADVTETDVYVNIPATELKAEAGRNRVLLCYPKVDRVSSDCGRRRPVIVLFHGGGHTVGNPESELPLARLLVQKYKALVVLPCYRLAPEHPYPASFSDSFEILKQIALDLVSFAEIEPNTTAPTTNLLPAALAQHLDQTSGFIIGGTSAGSTIAASIAHLYYHHRRASTQSPSPPLTGLLLSCGTYISPSFIPQTYKHLYLSTNQNKDQPPLDSTLTALFHAASRPDTTSPLCRPFDQQPHLHDQRADPSDDHRWLAETGVRVYFQACGADVARDDSLIYELMLSETCGVETRMDLYGGCGHVFGAWVGRIQGWRLASGVVSILWTRLGGC